jgi:hypothetical protein
MKMTDMSKYFTEHTSDINREEWTLKGAVIKWSYDRSARLCISIVGKYSWNIVFSFKYRNRIIRDERIFYYYCSEKKRELEE